MTCIVKFSHLEQTLFVHPHQFFLSLKRCLELYLWRKERNITLRNATWLGNLQIDFHLEDKKKVEIMNVLTFVVLFHFHIVSKLLIVLKINLAPSLQEEALSDNVMRNKMLINVGVLKGHYNKTTK